MAILELKSISKSFGGIKAVNGCSLGLEEGIISCLIGPNGAGKTTIFNIISGFLKPDTGSVSFRGKDITKLGPHQIVGKGIVRSWQNLRLFSEIKVIDNVLLAIQNQSGENLWKAMLGWDRQDREFKRNKEKALYYLEEVGLEEKYDSLGTALSYGQQKRLSMARLLATEGDLLLLDEPFSGLMLNPSIICFYCSGKSLNRVRRFVSSSIILK